MKFHVEIRLLDDFSIVDFQQGDSRQYVYDKTLTIFLEEKAIIPDEYKSYGYKCSGFMELSLINDCPFRSMLVTLSIKCRPWNVKKGGQIRNEIKSELSIPGT
ncbi:hypothetical protein [Carboxylicivirga taeanensis]|uniref:hypothetical protein n=1 Tax=Carboxylicivirga taeanensis TaxID=1416875 RepID=UPI003F6DB5C0